MRKIWLFKSIAAATLVGALPVAALAQQAVARVSVNVRAGPARDYPLVLQLGAGAPLAVQGCLDNYSWCDVIGPGNNRGWVYAGNIAYPYQSNDVPVLQYGAAIGLPIISFVFGSYWNDYYRGRPFYRDRARWANHPIPHGPAFGPRPGFGPGAGPGRPIPGGRPGFGGRPGDPGRPIVGRPGGPERPGGGPDRPTNAGRPGGPGGGFPGGRPGGGPPPNADGGRPGGGGGERGGGERGGGGERAGGTGTNVGNGHQR